MESKVFNKCEYFVYKNGDKSELGMVKRQIDDETYACYYHMGDTAAHTPVSCMHKLENGQYSPARRIIVRDLLETFPDGQWVAIYSKRGNAVKCMKENVPDYFLLQRVERTYLEWGGLRIAMTVSAA